MKVNEQDQEPSKIIWWI